MKHFIPNYAQIQYRCSMDLKNDNEMRHTQRILWNWLIRWIERFPKVPSEMKNDNKFLKDKRWFFEGNRDESIIRFRDNTHTSDISIRTIRYTQEKQPLFWGMEFIHPDSELQGVDWSTFVSLEYSEEKNALHFTAINKYHLRDYYLGKNPQDDITRSTPGFIPQILRDKNLKCYRDDLEFGAERYIEGNYNADEIPNLSRSLVSASRQLPFIILFFNDTIIQNNKPNVDYLIRCLRGNAGVFIVKPERALDELKHWMGLSENIYFQNGAANLKPGDIWCSLPQGHSGKKYNRIYPLETLSDQRKLDEIIDAVSRFSPGEPGELISFSSLILRRKRFQLSQHREELKQSREEASLYEEEYNSKLEKEKKSQATISNLNEKIDELNEYTEDLESENAQQQQLISQLKYELQQKTNSYEKLINIKSENTRLTEIIGSYITDIPKQLELAQKLFQDYLIILPEAFASSKDYIKQNRSCDTERYQQTWEILQDIVHILYPLVFENYDKNKNLTTLFNAKSRFTLTMNESSTTQRDKKIMRDRLLDYNDKQIDVSPHIKYGNGNDALRVHFYIDQEKKKIVIGHFGSHKDTAGTKKRK